MVHVPWIGLPAHLGRGSEALEVFLISLIGWVKFNSLPIVSDGSIAVSLVHLSVHTSVPTLLETAFGFGFKPITL